MPVSLPSRPASLPPTDLRQDVEYRRFTNNTIETLFDAAASGVDVSKAADVSLWPNAYFTDSTGINFYQTSLSNSGPPTLNPIGHTTTWGWQLAGNNNYDIGNALPEFDQFGHGYYFYANPGNDWYWCEVHYIYYTYQGDNPQAIFPISASNILATDSQRSIVVNLQGGGAEAIEAGYSSPPPTINLSGPVANQTLSQTMWNLCGSTPGMSCSDAFGLGGYKQGQAGQNAYNFCIYGGGSDHGYAQSQGNLPDPGFNGDKGLTSTQLNNPMGISAGPRANTVVIADTGNNRVRLLDLSAGSVSTIAGNGTTTDSGDGGSAINAGIFHPRGVIYDSIGNLYVSTEHGYIRKIDTSGTISTFAGNPTGTIADSLPANQIILRRPYGMAIDNVNGYLYVADMDANVVRRIDFQTQTAVAVAGSGSPAYNGENVPALNAGISGPKFLGLDPQGNLIIVDSGNQKIRRVNFQSASSGTLTYAPTSQDHSLLTRNSDGSFVRSYRNGNNIFFDPRGHEIVAQDRAGRQTSYAYDGNGHLAQITDPAGRKTIYNYLGGLLGSITDPANRTTTFSYDANGDLLAVTFPDGSQRRYTYDNSGLMLSETNERGLTTQYSYNQWGRLNIVTKPDGTNVAINDSGSATAGNNFTGGSSGTLQSYGTGPGQVYDGIKDAKSIETKLVKNFQGYISTLVDGNGNTTTIQRDVNGKPILITRPDNTTVSYVYDTNNSDPNRVDDLLSTTDTSTGITTSQTYDTYGNVVTQTNGNNSTYTNQYDPTTGLLTAKIPPLIPPTNFAYNNAFKLVSAVTNSLGKTSLYSYDSSGNQAVVKDPLNHTTSYLRDAVGNVISMTDANVQTTHYEYDAFNRLTAVVTPKGERTEYSYLPTGELVQIKDALGNLTTFQYDSLGRMIKKTDPLGFFISRSYDVNGNVIQEIDPNGNVKNYVYDNLNELIQKILPDNAISMAYDIRGRMIQVQNQQSILNFNYDVAGRLISNSTQGLGNFGGLPSVVIGYTYDADGNRLTMTDPVGQTQYQYDSLDRLIRLTNPNGEPYLFSFDAVNRLNSIQRPGSVSSFTFDDANFLSSIVHSSGVGTTLASFAYSRDNLGNVTQIQRGTINRSFAYDPDSQIVSATNPEAPIALQNESFTYDPIYNRTQDQAGSYSYDQKSQRLIQDYNYIYLYDNNGNLITKQAKGLTGEVTNYIYSSENQLLSFQVFEPQSSSPVKQVSYVYDAIGRRVQKQVVDNTSPNDPSKTFTRRYVYDGQEIILEYDGNNDLLARYTHSTLKTDDVLAAEITNSGVTAGLAKTSGSYMYLKDQLGSITDVASSNGAEILHYVYSAFGELIGIQDAYGSDVTQNPPLRTSYTFTGRELDSESGLYYYRARYYDPGTGRFLQKDPEPGKLNLPASVVNSYIYVMNNSMNLLDPTGKSFWSVLIGIGAILAGLAVAALTAGVALYAGYIIASAVTSVLGTGIVGGIIGAVGAGIIGSAIGSFGGGIAGGLVGGGVSLIGGNDWSSGYQKGKDIGSVVGAIGGAYLGGAGARLGGAESLTAINALPIVGPLGQYLYNNCIPLILGGAAVSFISGSANSNESKGSAFLIGQAEPTQCGAAFASIASVHVNAN